VAESVRWDCRTLAPKHNLSAGVRLADVAGTMMVYDYESLLEVPWDLPDAGTDLSEWSFSLPLALPLTGSQYLLLPAMSPAERVRFASAAAAVWPTEERTSARSGQIPRVSPTPNGPIPLEVPGDLAVSAWSNPAALPRAWIVHDLVCWPPLTGRDPRALRLRNEQVLLAGEKLRDLRRSAVVETAEPPGMVPLAGDQRSPSPRTSDRGESCRVADVNPERVEIEAELTRPGLVVLADQFYPGWHLQVETAGQASRPERILQTDRVLRGVWLPAGRHRLIYRYRPATFYLGAAVSLLAWLALGAAILYRRRRLGT
jgi:hypothetical protein